MSQGCGQNYRFMYKNEGTGSQVGLIPVLCKSWSCPVCKPKKAQQVKGFIRKHFGTAELWMITLTFYHRGTALNAWKGIGKSLNRLLTYARKYSEKFNYVRIVEPHKDGSWPHVHMLVDKDICSINFVKNVENWGFGWNMHCTPMDGIKGSNYLSKYLTKPWPEGDADLLRQIARTRIVSASRELGPIFKTETTWKVVKLANPSRGIQQLASSVVAEMRKNGATDINYECISEGFIIKSDGFLSPEFIECISGPLADLIECNNTVLHLNSEPLRSVPF